MKPVVALFASVLKPAQLAMRRWVSLTIDRRLGICTTDELVARELGRDVAVYRRTWRALGWSGVFRVLRHLQPGPDDVLLDIGCGAGRVVSAAARRPFARVAGLEIDPEFAALGRRNLATLRGRRCPAAVLEVDATEYEIPDDVNIVFLYNPFQGVVLDRVMERVFASHDRSPRRFRVVYANPVEADRLLERGRIRVADRLSLDPPIGF